MSESDDEQEVLTVIESMTDALNTGDAEKLDSLLSDRARTAYIGTDPSEWWTKQQLVAGIREAMSVGEGQVRAEQGETFVHVLGDVAWTEGLGKFTNGAGAERAIRLTGVFVREDGQWKAVQSHASIGVANENIFDS
jgi:ketosteroid isomerase-like protein